MHTRKRHQDMFQDLNRKLQHAEKEKDSPPADSKVSLYTSFQKNPCKSLQREMKYLVISH